MTLQDAFLFGQRDLDLGMLVVDDLHGGLNGGLAALPGRGHGTGKGEDRADLDDLFGGLGGCGAGAETQQQAAGGEQYQPAAPTR